MSTQPREQDNNAKIKMNVEPQSGYDHERESDAIVATMGPNKDPKDPTKEDPKEESKGPSKEKITPFYVAVQCLEWIRDRCSHGPNGRPPRRALDPCARNGVWSRAMKSVWPGIHVTAIERDKKYADALHSSADVVILDEFRPDLLRGQKFDIIASCPVFSEAESYVSGVHAHKLLRPSSGTFDDQRGVPDLGGILALLHYHGFTSRAEDMDEVVQEYPPTQQLDIPGTLIFVPDTKGDARSYAHFLWTEKSIGSHWRVENLPRLPARLRRHPTKFELAKIAKKQQLEFARATA